MLRCNARSVIFNAKFGTVRHSLPDLARLLALSETSRTGGILAAPVRDTMKRAEPGKNAIAHTVDRNGLWHALTPQFSSGY